MHTEHGFSLMQVMVFAGLLGLLAGVAISHADGPLARVGPGAHAQSIQRDMDAIRNGVLAYETIQGRRLSRDWERELLTGSATISRIPEPPEGARAKAAHPAGYRYALAARDNFWGRADTDLIIYLRGVNELACREINARFNAAAGWASLPDKALSSDDLVTAASTVYCYRDPSAGYTVAMLAVADQGLR